MTRSDDEGKWTPSRPRRAPGSAVHLSQGTLGALSLLSLAFFAVRENRPAAAATASARDAGGSDGGCPSRASTAIAALDDIPSRATVDVWMVPLADRPPVRIASVARQPDSPVSGAALPGTDLVALTVTGRAERDPTWSGTLYVVGPGRRPQALLKGVLAGGPLVATRNGRVFAVRGEAGSARSSADPSLGFRRDAMQVVAVEAREATVTPIARQSGDALFLLGVIDTELFAYRVGGAGARQTQAQSRSRPGSPSSPGDFVAIDIDKGTTRVVLAAPPLSRDFAFDEASRTLWFTAAAARGAAAADSGERYALYGLELTSARLSVVATGDSLAMMPHRWIGGRVIYRCPGRGGGLCIAGGAGTKASAREVVKPTGAETGDIQWLACTDAGDLAFGVRTGVGAFSSPFMWNVDEPSARAVPLPAGRIRFVGILNVPATPKAPR